MCVIHIWYFFSTTQFKLSCTGRGYIFDNIRLLNILAVKWRFAVFATRGKPNVKNRIVHISRKKPNRAKLSLDEILLSYQPTLFIQHTSNYRPINNYNDYDTCLFFIYTFKYPGALNCVYTAVCRADSRGFIMWHLKKSRGNVSNKFPRESASRVNAAGSGSFCGLCFCVKLIASD